MRIYRTYTLLLMLVATFVAVSCGEDRTHEFLEKTEENQWTYSMMKDVYLWADEIKQPERSQFFNTTSKFFSSLLHKSDNSSYFTDSVSTGSYGLTFSLMRDPLGVKASRYYALVLYVKPGSPAETAGIERGEWISTVNGSTMNSASGKLLQSGEAAELTTSYIDYDDENESHYWVDGDTIQMSASRLFNSRAIYLDTIYNVRDSKIAYIVCDNLNGASFADGMQEALLGFATADVTDVVVDLRYCNEGTLENANAMASALVPSSLVGTPFVTLKGKNGDSISHYTEQPVNLSDKRLFFITGRNTKGAAEMLVASVNASRGMHDVIVMGAQSAGANVHTERYGSPYGFSINPAVALICSSDGEELPRTGIALDYPIDELKEKERLHKLGSEQEYILRNIEYLIVNGSLPADI